MDITKKNHSKFHFDTLKLTRRSRRWRNNIRGKRHVNTVFNAVVAMLEAKVKFDVQKMIRNSFLNIGTYSTTAPTPDYPKGGVANIEFKERTMEFKKIPMNK